MGDIVAGLLTGLSLIVAIGAQNAFVLRQGLRRSHVALVVAICALSDVVLILAGVAGIGVVVDRAPWAIEVIRWLGVAFLTVYGVSSLLRARRPQALAVGEGVVESRTRRRRPGGRADLAQPARLPRHRPAARLDRRHPRRPRVAGGSPSAPAWRASAGSPASAYGARLAAPRLADPRAWQVLDVLIGLVMLAIAVRLALGA